MNKLKFRLRHDEGKYLMQVLTPFVAQDVSNLLAWPGDLADLASLTEAYVLLSRKLQVLQLWHRPSDYAFSLTLSMSQALRIYCTLNSDAVTDRPTTAIQSWEDAILQRISAYIHHAYLV